MQFKIDGVTYELEFRYSPNPRSGIRETRCIVWGIDKEDVHVKLASGTAGCSRKDIFCKEKGRKIALKYALEMTHFDAQQRATVWDAYFKRKPVPDYEVA